MQEISNQNNQQRASDKSNQYRPIQKEHYYNLIQPLGSAGRYQWFLFILSVMMYMQNALIVLGITYFYMNPSFDCSGTGLTLTEQQCEQYVCDNYSGTALEQFPIKQQIVSLSTEFGPFLCEENYILGNLRGFPFIGGLLGIILSSFYSDNKSRKKTFIINSVISSVGLGIVVVSQNIYMATFGLACANFGSIPQLRITQAIITETTQSILRQRFILTLGAGLSMGGLVGGILYELIKHWRYSSLYINFLPSIILCIISALFLKEVPKFILLNSQSPEEAAQKFNQIGKFNKVSDQNYYQPQDLKQWMKAEKQYHQKKQTVTFIDLFRYKSLRKKTIFVVLTFIILDIVFLSFNSVIDHIGLTPIINSTVISISEVAALPIAFFMIPYFRRIPLFCIATILAAIFSLAAAFIKVPQNCEQQGGNFCSQGITQLILIGLNRFFYSYLICVIYIILVQLFPTGIRNIALGFPTAIGQLGSLGSQIIYLGAYEKGINIFFITSIFYFLMFGFMVFVPQTKDVDVGDYIQQIGGKSDEKNEKQGKQFSQQQ